MIISLLNQKGGVGKTTLSINLATAFSKMNNTVLLIDADSQGSALDWATLREADPLFSVIGLSKPIIHKELPKIAKNFDIVIIDGPPRISDVAKSAIVASDLVLMPVQPSPYDVWAASDVVQLFNEVQDPIKEYKTIEKAFVINRKIKKTALGRDIIEALSPHNIAVLDSHVCQRVAFAESAARGSSVLEYDIDKQACEEVNLLTQEIVEKFM